MFDLRNHKELIKSEVNKLRDSDKNWGWSIKSLNKKEIRVNWGYGTYCGGWDGVTWFSIKLMEDKDTKALVTEAPAGEKNYYFIGENHWDDGNIEICILKAFKWCKYTAHNY